MDYKIVSLMDSLRVNIAELILMYIKTNITYNREQELNRLYTVLKKVAGDALMTRQLNEREMMEYMTKIADYIIDKWKKISNKYPEIRTMTDDDIMNIIQKHDKILAEFFRIFNETLQKQENKTNYKNIDYIG